MRIKVPAVWMALALVSALTLLPGCASLQAPQTRALLAQVPEGLPRQALLSDTPFFPQTELQCGPAALATVLGAAGVNVSPEALSAEVFVPERGGSLQIEMLAAARRHGLVSTRLRPDLADLLREVAAGHPAVVLLNLSLPIKPMWHYAVVVGHDLGRAEVLLRSGKTPLMRLPMNTFEHTWARSGRWAFVVLPPGQLPLTATELDVADAMAAFERLHPSDKSLPGYEAALLRWPGNVVLGMGLGNTLYARGDVAGAARAYEQVAAQSDSAAAWNNLASARLKLGDRAAALAAAELAVTRARQHEPQWLLAAEATLAEVRQAASSPGEALPPKVSASPP
jgi:tetratricopeptide (TPR) repeat protein